MIFDVYPVLSGEFLLLKKPELSDLPALEEMLRDADVYRYEPTYLPELVSKSAREFIESDCTRLFEDKSAILLGIYSKADPEHFLGLCELYGYSQRRNKISVGYRLKKENWNRGIASGVVSLLKDYILNELQLDHITAHVRVENPASVKCLMKNGFVQRREPHEEDWGFPEKVIANKYVVYPPEAGESPAV